MGGRPDWIHQDLLPTTALQKEKMGKKCSSSYTREANSLAGHGPCEEADARAKSLPSHVHIFSKDVQESHLRKLPYSINTNQTLCCNPEYRGFIWPETFSLQKYLQYDNWNFSLLTPIPVYICDTIPRTTVCLYWSNLYYLTSVIQLQTALQPSYR